MIGNDVGGGKLETDDLFTIFKTKTFGFNNFEYLAFRELL